MDSIFREYDSFVAIYIDDILVYSENKKKYIGNLQLVFKNFEQHGIIIIKPKMQLFSNYYRIFRGSNRKMTNSTTTIYIRKKS